MPPSSLDPTVEHDEELYRRVIASPASATRAERNLIRRLPPPEEEDRLCVARTGLTRDELQAKALSRPEELSYEAAKIATFGVLFDADAGLDFMERREQLRRRYHEPSPLQALQNAAEEALDRDRGEAEKMARLNACRVWMAVDRARREEEDRQWREAAIERRVKKGNRWIRDVLEELQREGNEEEEEEEGAGGCWGFVVFRTGCYGRGAEGEAAWRRFREYFDRIAEVSVLHWDGGPLLWPLFRAVFVEDDEELEGASDEQLRARFKRMREGGQLLPNGIATNCFLVADAAMIESEAVGKMFLPAKVDDVGTVKWMFDDPVVYIRAVDPDYHEDGQEAGKEERDGGEMAGYRGEARVALPRVFDWLYWLCFIAKKPAGLDGRNGGWRDIYLETREPEAWNRNWQSNMGFPWYYVPSMSQSASDGPASRPSGGLINMGWMGVAFPRD